MNVIRADTLGTCMGVRRALQMVDQTLASHPGTRVYTLGPLIHNARVVEEYRRKGVQQVSDVAGVRGGIVVVRTHGVGPGERRALEHAGVECVDATCPNVRRVQELVRSHAERGFAIVIVGDAGHGEVKGIRGYAPQALVIRSEAEAETVPLSSQTLVVSQTTFTRSAYRSICSVLARREPAILVRDTTCAATERRQESLVSLSASVDALVVIGGKDSANTRWLYQTARATGRPSWHVESADELAPEIARFATVGITAGASTPDALIDEVEAALRLL